MEDGPGPPSTPGSSEGAAHQFLGPNSLPDVWSVKKVNPSKMVHLTEKPVELALPAISYSSRAAVAMVLTLRHTFVLSGHNTEGFR